MRQAVHTLQIETRGKGLVPITRAVADWAGGQGIGTGLLTLWCQHTSASLTVQENADGTVRTDVARFFERLVPEGADYAHDSEGPDDMPAHLRTMLTDTQMTIPLVEGRLVLGTWQGIYLFEHRRRAHRRSVVMHLLGD